MVDALIGVDGGDQAAELIALAGWLRGERQLQGAVQLVRGGSGDTGLGGGLDVLSVAVGSGGVGVALAQSLAAWLRTRRSDVKVTITANGRTVEVDARQVLDVTTVINMMLGAGETTAQTPTTESAFREPTTRPDSKRTSPSIDPFENRASLNEIQTLARIDQLLEAEGWRVQDYYDINPLAGRGVAVREFPLATGRADYVLYVDQWIVGVIEAKSEGTYLGTALSQNERYAREVHTDSLPTVWRPDEPFVFRYATTGTETYFVNRLDPEARSREIFAFHRPETIAEWMRRADNAETDGVESSEAFHRTIVAVDVAGFTDRRRSADDQLVVQRSLHALLERAFDEASIDWASCEVEDRGDGKLILVPPDAPRVRLADQLWNRLHYGLRRHNAVHSDAASIQLRVALHAGDVWQSSYGKVGPALNFTFRILDSPQAKEASAESGETLVLIVSDTFYRDVIEPDPAAEPDAFRRISVEVKGATGVAWLRVSGVSRADEPEVPGSTIDEPRAHQFLPPTDVDWLRRLLDTVTVPQLSTLLRRAAEPEVVPAPPGATAGDVFAYLADLNAGPDGFPPALAFVELLASQVNGLLAEQLRQWNDEQATRLGLESRLAALRAANAGQADTGAHHRPQRDVTARVLKALGLLPPARVQPPDEPEMIDAAVRDVVAVYADVLREIDNVMTARDRIAQRVGGLR